MEMDCEEVLVMGEVEFVRIRLKGQSFLYNQIRKMVGAIVQAFRFDFDHTYIDNSLKHNSMKIPIAPGEGLMLNRVAYDHYNSIKDHRKSNKGEVSVPDCPKLKRELEDFRLDLVRFVGSQEREKQVFARWLAMLDYNKDDYFE